MNILFLDFLKKDENEENGIIIDNIIIKKIDIIDLSKIIQENGYLNISISTMINTTLFLCCDKETNEKAILYKNFLGYKDITTFLNKEYNNNFLKKVKHLDI